MSLPVRIFDKILNHKKCSEVVKSISTLHIVKFHSIYTRKKIGFFFIINKFFKLLIINNLKYVIFLIEDFFTKKNNNSTEKKILIISHFINIKHLNSKEDFYFGNFEQILNKKNKSFLKVMINHTSFSSSHINSKLKNKNHVVLEKYSNLATETKIFFKKIYTIFELIYLFFKKEIDLNILKKLIISLFDASTQFSLRIHYQIQNYVKKIKPEYCVLTYEGYSWERMCINGIKKIDKKIKCIGYQHTIISKNHRAIYKNIYGNYNPDTIWCSQLSSYRLIKKNKNFNKSTVYLIGNFKQIKYERKKTLSKNTFLVIPEGIYSECKNLFEISLKIAIKHKKFEFIWRVHPYINFSKVLKMLKLNYSTIPNNIIISQKKFDKDISRSRFVIYKGSAAVLRSVVRGNYPIYYSSSDEKNFDPISNFFNKKNYFKTEKDFVALVKKLQNKNYNKYLNKKISLLKRDMFLRPNLKLITKTLN